MMIRIMAIWNSETARNMTTANKFEQLREAVGGFKKSDTLTRFEQDLAYRDSRKKSQLVALKILRTLRRQGRSQKQFAEQLNVSPQQVSKWVKGSENFTFETIEKIEKALGITLIAISEEKLEMTLSRSIVVSGSYQSVRVGRIDVPHPTKQTWEGASRYSHRRQYA